MSWKLFIRLFSPLVMFEFTINKRNKKSRKYFHAMLFYCVPIINPTDGKNPFQLFSQERTENTLDFPFHPQQPLFLSQLQSFQKKAFILNSFSFFKKTKKKPFVSFFL